MDPQSKFPKCAGCVTVKQILPYIIRCGMYVLCSITAQLSKEALETSGFRVVMYSCQLVNVTEMVRTEVNMWRMVCSYVLSNQNIFIAVVCHTTLT